MTEKLYYLDSHMSEFEASVISCEPRGERWGVVLSRTAFFPEGGGQPGDAGTLGEAAVSDTWEQDGEIIHLCDRPLSPGRIVPGKLNWALRFARMQNHTAEHILSGLAYRLWGCCNVGFHMPEKDVTLDFDRELSARELELLEQKANETVWANVAVRAFFPTKEELTRLAWRQKKEPEGDIRLVEIAGVDLCACCVPHVARTGEIGAILLTDAMRHRGGMRLTMRAGAYALETVLRQKKDAQALSRLFSAPQDALPAAGERVLQELEEKKAAAAAAERDYAVLRGQTAEKTEGNLLFFENRSFSTPAMRVLANAGAEKAGGFCGVFAGEDGAWRYVLCSRQRDLRGYSADFNRALGGRGGGSAEMIQGSCTAPRDTIESYIRENNL